MMPYEHPETGLFGGIDAYIVNQYPGNGRMTSLSTRLEVCDRWFVRV